MCEDEDSVGISIVPEQVVGLAVTDDYSLDTHGVELSAGYLALDNLRFYLSYSYLHAKGEWNGGTYSSGSFKTGMTLMQQQYILFTDTLIFLLNGS